MTKTLDKALNWLAGYKGVTDEEMIDSQNRVINSLLIITTNMGKRIIDLEARICVLENDNVIKFSGKKR